MTKRRCPRCNGADIVRSRTRGPLERLARTINMFPFRCIGCYHRFFAIGRA